MVPHKAILQKTKIVILELLLGCIASTALILFFRVLDYTKSINNWILSISKFVYFSGHPRLDDDQKFALITREYKSVALSLLGLILKTLLIILVALATVAVLVAGRRLVQGNTLPASTMALFPKYLLDWPFIVGTLLPLVSLCFLPKKAREDDYSALDRFLHYLFLGNKTMTRLQFWFECTLNARTIRSTAPSQHIYVSGLARSGSTSLMQYLGQLPGFVSLSYRNMPFVFMPRTGSKLVSKKKAEVKVRAHKDGMTHSLSSYEALEEPFWLHYVGSDYIDEDRLSRHSIPKEVHSRYQKFRTLVADDKTYLAKNNNHLLRAKSLHQLDAEKGLRTRTIIPFREPYAQAKSLLQQHRILSSLQSKNDFALDYMDLLAHHEFGLDRKTTMLTEEAEETFSDGDPDSIEHWLNVWYVFYRDALHLYAGESGFCFFCYENYQKDPRGSLLSLCSFIHVAPARMESIGVKRWQQDSSQREATPGAKLAALYEKMAQVAINHEVC